MKVRPISDSLNRCRGAASVDWLPFSSRPALVVKVFTDYGGVAVEPGGKVRPGERALARKEER